MENTFTRFPRRKFIHPVGVLLRGEYEIGETVQISEGGISIESPFELKPEDKICASFRLDGELYTTCICQVVRQNGGQNQYELNFEDLEFQARKKIRHMVAAYGE